MEKKANIFLKKIFFFLLVPLVTTALAADDADFPIFATGGSGGSK
jgi:hypothetical protein